MPLPATVRLVRVYAAWRVTRDGGHTNVAALALNGSAETTSARKSFHLDALRGFAASVTSQITLHGALNQWGFTVRGSPSLIGTFPSHRSLSDAVASTRITSLRV